METFDAPVDSISNPVKDSLQFDCDVGVIAYCPVSLFLLRLQWNGGWEDPLAQRISEEAPDDDPWDDDNVYGLAFDDFGGAW